MEFCKAFNAQTQDQDGGTIIPVVITVYEDRSFTFVTKTPPAAVLIKQAIDLDKGSGEPHRDKVGKIIAGPAARDRREEARRPERARRRRRPRRSSPAPPARWAWRWSELMAKHGKRYLEAARSKVDREHEYEPAEAIGLVKELQARQVRRVGRGPRPHRPERPPRRRAAARHDRAAQRPRQGASRSPSSPRATRRARPRRPAPTSSAPRTSPSASRRASPTSTSRSRRRT